MRIARARRTGCRVRAQSGTPPGVARVPPPISPTGADATEYETAAAKSLTLEERFADAAEAVGAELLDLDGVVRYSDDDPIHLDVAGHHALAWAVEAIVRQLAPPAAATASIAPFD